MDKNIGLKILEARKKRGLTREQVARKIGVSQQQLARYENGENHISADRLALIAIAVHQAIDYFYTI